MEKDWSIDFITWMTGNSMDKFTTLCSFISVCSTRPPNTVETKDKHFIQATENKSFYLKLPILIIFTKLWYVNI